MSLTYREVKGAVKLRVKTGHIPSIVGLSGIGKTEMVKSIAEELGSECFVLTATLLQEGDLAMPYLSDSVGSKLSEIFNKSVSLIDLMTGRKLGLNKLKFGKKELEDKGIQFNVHYLLKKANNYCEEKEGNTVIFFIDEWNRAELGVMNEMMNLLQQGEIQGTKVHPNVSFVLAGNPTTDIEGFEGTSYTTNQGDNGVKDRIKNIIMQPNLEQWIDDYATKIDEKTGETKVDMRVVRFLVAHESYFHTENHSIVYKTGEDKHNATPRSWKELSDVLREYEKNTSEYFAKDFNQLEEILSGDIGYTISNMFVRFLNVEDSLLTVEDFLSQPTEKIEKELKNYSVAKQNILLSMVFNYFKNDVARISKEKSNKFFENLLLFPEDLQQKYGEKIYNDDVLQETKLKQNPLLWDLVINNANMLSDNTTDIYAEEN